MNQYCAEVTKLTKILLHAISRSVLKAKSQISSSGFNLYDMNFVGVTLTSHDVLSWVQILLYKKCANLKVCHQKRTETRIRFHYKSIFKVNSNRIHYLRAKK